MKLSDILKASCKHFSMKFLEVHHFLRNYVQYFAKEVNKILWKSFLVNKRKRFNTITVHLKCTTLLFLQKKGQDLSLLLLQGLDCLILLSLYLLTLYNELVMMSFPSFFFIFLFLQVLWSKSTSELNFQLCFYLQCHFHLGPYVFMSLQIFPLLFFLISWAFFSSFLISDCLFWVFFESASAVRSLSSNLSRSSRSCYLWLFFLFLTCNFSWR